MGQTIFDVRVKNAIWQHKNYKRMISKIFGLCALGAVHSGQPFLQLHQALKEFDLNGR